MINEHNIQGCNISTNLLRGGDMYTYTIAFDNNNGYFPKYKLTFKCKGSIEIEHNITNDNFIKYIIDYDKITDNKFKRFESYHKIMKDIWSEFAVSLEGRTGRKSTRRKKS